MRTSVLVIASLLALAAGCGAANTPSTTARLLEETRIVAMRDESGGYRFDTYTAEDLFRQGTALQAEHHCDDAVARYDRIAVQFPSSRYLSPSLYNAALCLQESGSLDGAATRYYQLVDHLPDSEDAKVARLQLTGVLVQLDRWEEALASANLLLARTDLESYERLEAMARRAQALLGMRRLQEATEAADAAGEYYRTRRGDEAIGDPYFAAAAMFVRAESIRARSEAMTMPTATALEQHEVLEHRAQLILDAQRAYFDTIRLTNAHWAAAAGYRIGSMYETLYADMSTAPVPPPSVALNDQAMADYREQYRAELRRRIEPLVRHAIRYWELTLLMVERTGVDTQWTVRTRSELERAHQLLATGVLPQQDRGTALADPRGGAVAPDSLPDAAP
jgi:tetratricopeptide (TPR) repeat protein